MSFVGLWLDPPFDEAGYRRMFAVVPQEGVDAVVVANLIENWMNLSLITGLAPQAGLPAIYLWREAVEMGGLMAYAYDLLELGRQAADQAAQILRGAKPGDIPIYQPTTFQLSINLTTAKALGLSISPSLLPRADKVIE
jgi:putative ABC transport system substrate-binding protein